MFFFLRYKEKLSFLHTQFEELSKKKKGQTEPLQVVKPAYVTKPSSKTLGAPGRLPALLPNQNLVTRKNTELPPLRPGLPKSHTLRNGMVLDFNSRGLKRDGDKDIAALATNRGPPSHVSSKHSNGWKNYFICDNSWKS